MSIIYAIFGMLAILGFGYWELKKKEDETAGLTTWGFAAAPFLGVLICMGVQDGLPASLRFVLILLLILAAWGALRVLFRRARNSRRDRKAVDRV